jgi:hypothetical protein
MAAIMNCAGGQQADRSFRRYSSTVPFAASTAPAKYRLPAIKIRGGADQALARR